MATTGTVGSVAGLWRFPIKSMGGEQLENGWIGRELAFGDTVRIRVALPDPRCVMTTPAQDELPNDTEAYDARSAFLVTGVGSAS